jgi:pimeloyl-ACP methyl ester carboxylesterase
MNRVTSTDGTSIAFEHAGSGPPVVLVGGGLDDGSENAPLVPELAKWFSVFNYARRGRGESSDTRPYAVLREIEDIEALIAEAGGSAHLYGVSSGGALALEAAAAGLPIDCIAVYEVPYNIAADWPRRWLVYRERLGGLLAEDRRADALALFMRVTGASDEEIAGARSSPFWPVGEALAHTLAYDAECLADGQPPASRFASINQPTLVATGVGWQEPGAAEWVLALDDAADAMVAMIPHAERQIFEGQGHVADPMAVAPLLARFFGPRS